MESLWDKVQHPRNYEADTDELKKRLAAVKDPLSRRADVDCSEDDRNKKTKAYEVKEVCHFFLPSLMSTASMAAR